MYQHTVEVDSSVSPASIRYPDVFNVAVPLIDQHLDKARGGMTAIVFDDTGETVSYGQLAERVNRCGNLLKSLAGESEGRVLMVVKDCPEFFYVFWGAIKAGLIPVPLNTLLRADDYRHIIEDSDCAGLVYSPEFRDEVARALAGADHQPTFILCTEGPSSVSDMLEEASAILEPAATSADSECFWLYSSGSTGRPKGAVHRHRDIVTTCVHYAADTLGVTEDDVCFSAAKLFFAYGLGNAMTFPLWAGATAVLSGQRPTPDMTFDIIDKHKPTLYFGVPTLYAAQLRALDDAPRDLSSLRACVSAGEALPADIFRRWRERTGTLILDGIGSTEALHIFISNTSDDYRPGTSGRPVPGYEARIVDEEGDPVAAGETGRLFIRGDSTAPYYWNNPERTAETMVDGWLNTGDTYYQDSEGYYVYCGRSDDMLKVGGIWCSPVEIEGRLIEHPRVLEAAVVGRADADELIKPDAFVVLKEAGDASDYLADELLEHCKSGLARYKYPRWVNFVEDLPKTATGKVQRYRLRV
jgi:benzoate-CoA ligase family protein